MKAKDKSVELNLNAQIKQGFFHFELIAYKIAPKVEIIITSGSEAATKHKKGSKHYTGDAVDIRSKTFTTEQQNKILNAFYNNRDLRLNFDLLLESKGKPNEHFHLEYDPK